MRLVDTYDANCKALTFKNNATLQWDSENKTRVTKILKKLKDESNFLSQNKESNERSFEKCDFDKKLTQLRTDWRALSTRFAVDVENWAAQRRISLQKLENLLRDLENMKLLSSLGRGVLCSADAIGTGVALVLQSMQNSWSRSVLHASGVMGLSGLAVTLTETYKSKASIESVIEVLRKDREMSLKILKYFKKFDKFDREVQNLFPHGIDTELLEFVRIHISEDSAEKKELYDALKPFGLLEGNCVIGLVVILSNARYDNALLDDESFIQSVKKFSTSSFVKEWWNRSLHPKNLPSSKVPEAISKLQDLLKSKAILQRIPLPLITTPAMYSEGVPTILSIFLNSIMAIDAFLELNKKEESHEEVALNKVRRALQTEYDEVLQLNELLNPHYN